MEYMKKHINTRNEYAAVKKYTAVYKTCSACCRSTAKEAGSRLSR